MQLSQSKLLSLFAATLILGCAAISRADDIKTETPSLEVQVDTKPSLVMEKPPSISIEAPAKTPAPVKAKAVKPKAKTVSEPAKITKPKSKPKAKPKLGAVTPINDFELGRYQYCGADSDCVVATNGCCDCANGGKDVSVNKERLADFQKRFDCLYSKCGDKPSDPICGSGVVSCVMHKCQYFPPGEGVEDRF